MTAVALATESSLRFARLAILPLMAAAFVVLALQPLYLLSLTALPTIAPTDRIATHVKAAFEEGVLSPDGSPKSRLWRGGEQLTECISLGTGLNQAATPWRRAIAQAYPVFGDTHACEGLQRAVIGAEVTWQPRPRYEPSFAP
jgi:hypothetical protein